MMSWRSSVRIRSVWRTISVIVRCWSVGGTASFVDMLTCGHLTGSDLDTVTVGWHWHMVWQFSAGEDEEWLASNHDVGVVGVVIDLPDLSQCLSHLHHLFVGVCLGLLAWTASITPLPQSEMGWKIGNYWTFFFIWESQGSYLQIQAIRKTKRMTRIAEQTAMMIRLWKVSSRWAWLSMITIFSQLSYSELSKQDSSSGSNQGGLGGGGRSKNGGGQSSLSLSHWKSGKYSGASSKNDSQFSSSVSSIWSWKCKNFISKRYSPNIKDSVLRSYILILTLRTNFCKQYWKLYIYFYLIACTNQPPNGPASVQINWILYKREYKSFH